jgi:iron complex outermembrane receptor protein
VNPISWDFDQETTAWAVFGSIDWSLGDVWTLVTGLRYTDEEVNFVGATSGLDLTGGIVGGTGGPFEFNSTDDTFADENTTWRVALEARPTDDLLGYASVSTGFKSGGFNGDFIIDPTGYEPFDSETVTAYELGAKWTLGGGIAQLDGAVFFYDYQDIQTIVPAAPPNPGFQLGNLDSADVAGVDLDLAVLATDQLSLRVGVGYLDTEVKDSREGFDGAQLPNAPELQVTAGARWDIPLGSVWALSLQADLKYADSTVRVVPNSPFGTTDSYTLANARVALLQPDGKWEFALWGRNIADETYFIEAFEVFDPLGATAKLAGTPQVWGVSANYRFQ